VAIPETSFKVEEIEMKIYISNFRTCMLGLINGAIYSVTMCLLIWWLRRSSDERNVLEGSMSGDYVHLVSNERWTSIVIIWLVLFTLASLAANYFWRYGKNHILFWEVVGLLAVAAWNVFALFGAWLDWKYAHDTMSYTLVTSLHNPLFGPISLGIVIVLNFFYGYLVAGFSPTSPRPA
jgi:hypothetical protein